MFIGLLETLGSALLHGVLSSISSTISISATVTVTVTLTATATAAANFSFGTVYPLGTPFPYVCLIYLNWQFNRANVSKVFVIVVFGISYGSRPTGVIGRRLFCSIPNRFPLVLFFLFFSPFVYLRAYVARCWIRGTGWFPVAGAWGPNEQDRSIFVCIISTATFWCPISTDRYPSHSSYETFMSPSLTWQGMT